ncbi:lysosomal Pro-X carboxypeptidase isoform X2 [Cinnamomum micranthum f. kanehirae]|uniref:Lysosomal Pro-X carboxypeptidase isoform X2 n=1 Tax=Cinnamomum micranthum f. kanehirae TaxID=337451 RepID=A0A443PK42_9MAGN|nr:lysosomal Pro-X carboxypeptidase isoform X2 [Cinnamomum micranthum f. kanehirae]
MDSSLLFLLFTILTTTIPTVEPKSNSYPISFPRSYHPSLIQTKEPTPNLPFKTHFFPQILDHFTFLPQSYSIFYQKYLINSDYWDNGPIHRAPIFVYTGNEGDIEWFAANTGFMLEIAPKFHALLVFIEHRFYGESKPFGKDSYNSADTLGYLNSQQALADYAVLIRSLKQNLSAEASPVVVFGGSYGGMLAAWFRLKYPHIAIGALASSAPILQFEDIIPWTSFYDAVSKDYKDASLNCFDVIKGSWDELETLSARNQALVALSRTFRTCKNLQSVYLATNWLWRAFVYTAMVNYPMQANFIMPLPAYPVEQMCKIIDGFPPEASKLTKVFSAASLYYNFSGTEKCFNIENATDAHGLSGWEWQACTEMVMPMSRSNESMFPPSTFDYKAFGEQCMMKYGIQPRAHWIITEFGGTRIEQVLKRFGSNIIFSNGMKDPWSRGSVLRNISSTIVALVTEKGAHHVDLRYSTKEDPDWLIEQRRKEVEIIQRWIDEYHAGFEENN